MAAERLNAVAKGCCSSWCMRLTDGDRGQTLPTSDTGECIQPGCVEETLRDCILTRLSEQTLNAQHCCVPGYLSVLARRADGVPVSGAGHSDCDAVAPEQRLEGSYMALHNDGGEAAAFGSVSMSLGARPP